MKRYKNLTSFDLVYVREITIINLIHKFTIGNSYKFKKVNYGDDYFYQTSCDNGYDMNFSEFELYDYFVDFVEQRDEKISELLK